MPPTIEKKKETFRTVFYKIDIHRFARIIKHLLNLWLANVRLNLTVCKRIMVFSEAPTVDLTDRLLMNCIIDNIRVKVSVKGFSLSLVSINIVKIVR